MTLGGFLVPNDQVPGLSTELERIKTAFEQEVQSFLAGYDHEIADWINRHPHWARQLREAVEPASRVATRFAFRYRPLVIRPADDHPGTLAEGTAEVGGTIFHEVAQIARDLEKSLVGQTQMSQRALGTFRRVRDKLAVLSFVDPLIPSVLEPLEGYLRRVPRSGPISGDLFREGFGLWLLLRDEDRPARHGAGILAGEVGELPTETSETASEEEGAPDANDPDGTEADLNRSGPHVRRAGPGRRPAGRDRWTDHLAQILTAALLLILRHRVLGQPALADAAHKAERVLRQTFPAALVHRLLGLLTEVRGLGSTAEAAALAGRIQQSLEAEAQASQPAAAPSCDSGAELEPDGDASHASDDPLQRVLVAGEGELVGDLFNQVRQALISQSGDTGFGPSRLPVGEEASCNPRLGEVLHRQVEARSRALIARLQGLVQSSRMDRPQAVCRGRTLVPARLHRAGVGDLKQALFGLTERLLVA